MKLGNFTFPNEPESLRVSYLRNVSVETSADGAWNVTDQGKQGRSFDCEGVFYASSCYLSCKGLAQIFDAGATVTLTHPQWGEISVLMTQLEIDEACKTNFLRYKFKLVEMPK